MKKLKTPSEYPDMESCKKVYLPRCISKYTDETEVQLCLGKECSGETYMGDCLNKCPYMNEEAYSLFIKTSPEALQHYNDTRELCISDCKYKTCIYKTNCKDAQCAQDCVDKVPYTSYRIKENFKNSNGSCFWVILLVVLVIVITVAIMMKKNKG